MPDVNPPLVSIVMPNYNGAEFLEETISSVLNQTYRNWELIICDDCSNDNSLKIIKEFNDRRILEPLQLSINQGAAVARNKAIKNSHGDYIAFLDNDDFWTSDKLEKQIAFMNNNDYLFTYTDYFQFSEDYKKPIKCKKRVTYRSMLKNNYILTSTVIYNVKVLGKIYMENIRKRQDWSLFINIIKKTKDAYNINLPLAYYRRHKNSLSASKFSLVKYNFNFYQKVLGFSYLKSILYMIQFLFYYFLKKGRERFGSNHL